MKILNDWRQFSLVDARRWRQQSAHIIYLALLTIFLLMLEISFFVECNSTYFYDYTFMTNQMSMPWSMLPGIIFFICAQLLVHFGFSFLIWLYGAALAVFFKWPETKSLYFTLFLWFIAIVIILCFNQVLLPNSRFTELTILFFSDKAAYIIAAVGFYSFMFISVFLLMLLLQAMFKRLPKLSMVSIAIGIISYGYLQLHQTSIHAGATQDKPNIILIGVDSLRPDYIGYFGRDINTPFMDGFLAEASVFSETITPLARTFPSWIGILTGTYPRVIGIRSNLILLNHFDITKTLAYQLRKEGYETLFATDETRFSNIDTYFGFDHAATPPIGVHDFLLGTLNDFPISNLIINTKLGQWLFPHSFANRPVFFTYQPDSFLQLMQPYLVKNRSQPLFLAVHFCLPHHPYLWANASFRDKDARAHYHESIERVDQQLQDFYAMLQKAHLLDHAVVILLSDHGEALEIPGDRVTEAPLFISANKSHPPKFYPPNLDHEAINESVGHGTDVLSITQYHALLAVKLIGLGEQYRGNISGVVSLLDIKPTILDIVRKTSSSHSLTNFIRSTKAPAIDSKRHIFLENDFSPAAIRTVYPETKKVLLEGIKLFQIDPKTTRLTVKDSMLKMIIKSKQYADIYDHWMLALYPQNENVRMPILINLETGLWTNDLNSDFAQHSPAKTMLGALRNFYAEEIDEVR